ncbi:alpha/beta fold hydrolase [Bradyrhizobium guangzhouense]|uniref:alpha/beta fold hydrolase n=1 Tax=Bradyrhizobium guangzhouense TaxID=1325095 RepID=UPI001009E67F|nr:alpha/beta hydrolase [Bradyrhizobium guangzhouense]RXH11354.1 alpha/beta hydrolase [Bradyrhizobium guangzhouense]
MKEPDLLHTPAPGADQFSFHIRECGGGDATCILLHGFGEGGYVWNDFAPRLPKNYRTIIIDFRGHGNSGEDPTGNYGVGSYSTDVLNLIQKYKLRNISLVGHSLGAAVALQVAAAVPHLVTDLVLVDFSLSTELDVSENILSQFQEQCDGYSSLAEYAAWISAKRPLTHPRMLGHIVDNALRESADGRLVLKVDRRIQQIMGTGSARADDVRPILSKISCRTLLIRGRGSAVLSKKEAFDIIRLLKDGQLHEISHAGHAVMVEDPDEFADAVNQFLLGPRTSGGGL